MIAHVDGDAFFASVYQATHPAAKGKPVAIGKERALATAVSYEAKARGITRGMLVSDIKRICPDCIIASSNYYTYETFCRKIITIAEKHSPAVERYSIDEIFAEVDDPKTGLIIKKEIEQSLDISVSVGVSLTKSLAKLGSNFKKPSGYFVINKHDIPTYLGQISVSDIWGIGWQLSKRMRSLGIQTALDFITQPVGVINTHFNKTVLEIWYELQGHQKYHLNTEHKTAYKSIQNTQTHTPATNNHKILLSRTLDHIEKAFIKARRHDYQVGSIHIFLKTQKFTYRSTLIKLPQKISYPFLIRQLIEEGFNRIYNSKNLYRATGCTLFDLEKTTCTQQSLFSPHKEVEERLKKLYALVDQKKIGFASRLFDRQKSRKTYFALPEITF